MTINNNNNNNNQQKYSIILKNGILRILQCQCVFPSIFLPRFCLFLVCFCDCFLFIFNQTPQYLRSLFKSLFCLQESNVSFSSIFLPRFCLFLVCICDCFYLFIFNQTPKYLRYLFKFVFLFMVWIQDSIGFYLCIMKIQFHFELFLVQL